jgi:hypothetical protein
VTEHRFRTAARAFLGRRPFQPFIIELNTSTRFHVTHPENLQIRDGIVSYFLPGEKPRTFVFDHESVNQIFDPPAETDRDQ